MNKFTGMGRLTRDPELRYIPNGAAVCEIRIALNHRWKDKQTEEVKEKTTFVDVIFWRRAAEIVAQHFHKGKMIAVVGYLDQEEWTDQQGQKRSKIKVTADEFHFCGDTPRSQDEPSESSEVKGVPTRTAPFSPPTCSWPKGNVSIPPPKYTPF